MRPTDGLTQRAALYINFTLPPILFHLSSYPFLLYTTRAAIIAIGSFTRANRFGVAWHTKGTEFIAFPRN